MWRKEGWTQENPITAELFAEMAMDFCSKNSFARPPQAPRSGNLSTATTLPTKRPLTEEEQLQAAMKASLEDTGASDSQDGTTQNEVINIDDDEGDAEAAKPASTPSLFDELVKLPLPDEPEKGARILFRMPDGKRIVRKFSSSDSLKTVYAFITVSLDSNTTIQQAFVHSHISFLLTANE